MESTVHHQFNEDTDVIPGTIYLIDHRKASTTKPQKSDVLLVPAPAPDLHDPLRWSAWRKRYHLFLLVAYSTLMTALGNWEASIYLDITEALGTTVTLMNVGTALTLLMLGVGNVFFTPLSHKFGRRFTYLSSLIVVIASQIWLAKAENSGDFIGAHVLFGFGRAPYEALVAISIADVFFAHERGLGMGTYAFGMCAGSALGPICSGYMIETMAWRWVYWWGTILCGVVWVVFFFTLEESRFIREDQQEQQSGNAADAAVFSADGTTAHTPGNVKSLQDINTVTKGDDLELQHHVSEGSAYRVGEVLDADKFKLQTRLWTIFPGTLDQFIKECYRPLQLVWFPAILWSGIEYGSTVSWISILGTTTGVILTPAPYHMDNEALGLIWLSTLVGALFGSWVAGPLNDKLMMVLTRRNKGWREPEFRLWSFIPVAFINPAGLILYGVGAAKGLPWIGPVIGMGFVGFGLSVAASLTMAYVVDCYKAIDGEAVTAVILIRNIIGCAMTFGIQPWIDSSGVQNTFVAVSILSFVVTIGAGLLIVWGKKSRVLTKDSYLHYASIFNEKSK